MPHHHNKAWMVELLLDWKTLGKGQQWITILREIMMQKAAAQTGANGPVAVTDPCSNYYCGTIIVIYIDPFVMVPWTDS